MFFKYFLIFISILIIITLGKLTISLLNFNIGNFIYVFLDNLESFKLTFIVNTFVIILVVLISYFISIYLFKKNNSTLLNLFIPYPHVSFAIGVFIFFTTSGIFERLLNIFNNNQLPRNDYLDNVELSILYIVSLTIREVPFLVITGISMLNKINTSQIIILSRNLKISDDKAYLSIIFPLWLKNMIFPLLIIISFTYSNYEYSYIFGTQFPEFLNQIYLNEWSYNYFNNKNNVDILALIIILCLLLTIIFIYLIYIVLKKILIFNVPININFKKIGKLFFYIINIFFIVNFIIMVLTSISINWNFPNIIPNNLTLNHYTYILTDNYELLAFSILISLLASSLLTISLIYVHEMNQSKYKITINLLLYSSFIILLIPQNIFLVELNSFFNFIVNDAYLLKYLISLLIYTVPYGLYLIQQTYNLPSTKNLRKHRENLKISKLRFFRNITIQQLGFNFIFCFMVCFCVCFYQYLQAILITNGTLRLFNNEVMVLFNGESNYIASAGAIINLMPCLILFILGLKKNV